MWHIFVRSRCHRGGGSITTRSGASRRRVSGAILCARCSNRARHVVSTARRTLIFNLRFFLRPAGKKNHSNTAGSIPKAEPFRKLCSCSLAHAGSDFQIALRPAIMEAASALTMARARAIHLRSGSTGRGLTARDLFIATELRAHYADSAGIYSTTDRISGPKLRPLDLEQGLEQAEERVKRRPYVLIILKFTRWH